MTTAPDIFLSYNREDQAVAGTRQPTSQGSALGRKRTLGPSQNSDLCQAVHNGTLKTGSIH